MKVQLKQPKIDYPVFEMTEAQLKSLNNGDCYKLDCGKCPYSIHLPHGECYCKQDDYLKMGYTLEAIKEE